MKEPASKIDESVKIPAAVAAAAARADALHRQAMGQPEGEVDENGNPKPAEGAGNEGQPQEQEGVTPEGNLAQPEPKSEPKADAKSEPKPDAKSEAKPDAKLEDGETWEHKYKSVHGRLVRQNRINEEMQEQIRNLQNVIATLQSGSGETGKQGQSGPSDAEIAQSLLTPEEIADYGPDFLTVVGKKAREELAPILKQYQDHIANLEAQLGNVAQVTAQTQTDKMKATMDSQLPDWRKLNTDPAFLDWLSLPDPYSGVIRHDMLKAAYSQGDAPRTLAFFKGFLAQEAAVAPAQGEPDKGTTRVPKVPLADLAAPGRAKTAATDSTPAEKPFITRDQISMFYADVAAGKYRGRDADKKATEEQIFAAQREGRIR